MTDNTKRPWHNPWTRQPDPTGQGRYATHPDHAPGPGAICRWCKRELHVYTKGPGANVLICLNCDTVRVAA